MYQKCPVCNGDGIKPCESFNQQYVIVCKPCNGMGIISSVTGLPPQPNGSIEITNLTPHSLQQPNTGTLLPQMPYTGDPFPGQEPINTCKS